MTDRASTLPDEIEDALPVNNLFSFGVPASMVQDVVEVEDIAVNHGVGGIKVSN